jgi:hypothetical protein
MKGATGRQGEGPEARGGGEPPRAKRLRELCAAADPPLEPYEGLRRRVGEMAARHDARAVLPGSRWSMLRIRWAPAFAIGSLAAFLVASGWIYSRWNHDRVGWLPAVPLVRQPHLPPVTAGPGSAGQPAWDAGQRRIALTHPAPAGGPVQGIQPASSFRREAERVAWERLSPPYGPRAPAIAWDDLGSLNGDPVEDAQWSAPSAGDEWESVETRVRRVVRVGDDFIRIPFPRLAAISDQQVAAAVESYKREAAIVDPRLSREVTLQQKATALSELCELLRSDTGIQLTAGQSVADEKVTLLCRQLPLRDVMRQLSRPFGYTWLRSRVSARGAEAAGAGAAGEYRYELVQDLRSQLLEEELRNRDRNAALLALEREIDAYRPFLGLTPDEALTQVKTAAPSEKKLLEKLSGFDWGPIQIYARLSAQDLAVLRAGQELKFSALPQAGERLLQPDVARGALQPFRDWYLVKRGEDEPEKDYRFAPDKTFPGALPVPRVPEARARIGLQIRQSELGKIVLHASVFWFTVGKQGQEMQDAGVGVECAMGMSPAVLKPENAAANAPFAHNPALRPRVTVRPTPSCRTLPEPNTSAESIPEAKVTTADVLDAFHQATGLPIIADYYTRLYKPETVSVRNTSLFDALNQVGDTMRMRWRWQGGWLQLRTTGYYDDRLKEVPNRLLSRWAAERKRQGMLSLDDLVEIAQLPDAQLDAESMAEGARECWGLPEWKLVGRGNARDLRRHLRYLAGFTPAQRREAMGATGLPFTRMPLAQQQQFISLALSPKALPLQSLEELAGATLRVEYTQPGWFQWGELGWGGYFKWAVPLVLGPQGRRALRPPVRERTRESTLQAVRRVDPKIREALLEALRRNDPRLEAASHVVEEDQIHPTRLDLIFVYVPGLSNARGIFVQGSDASGYPRVW